MAIPIAHPAAVLPLRRLCPRFLVFSALVIGSLLPDAAYVIGDVNKFSRTLHAVFGSAVAGTSWVKESREWDDLSHAVVGSLVFCLPVGLVLFAGFTRLRGALVEMLPNPHRDALRPLCVVQRTTAGRLVSSLLVGAWTHLVWDSLTNGDRWLGRHWAFLHLQVFEAGEIQVAVYRALWVVSTVVGVFALGATYLRFLARRAPGRLYESAELRCYLRWLAGLIASLVVAVVIAFRFASPFGSLDEQWRFLHRLAGFFIATTATGVVVAATSFMVRTGATRTLGRSPSK